MKNLKVVVIDDSVLYRKLVTDSLKAFPNVEVVSTAHNGKVGIDKIKQFKPDFVTLDVEMPVMNGIETLKEIEKQKLNVRVIMISTLTAEGAKVTIDALAAGAFDFLKKPTGKGFEENKKLLSKQLIPIVRTLAIKSSFTMSAIKRPTSISRTRDTTVTTRRPISVRKSTLSPRIIALGISTGGPNALNKLIPKLPKDLKVPIVLVQHMPPIFTKALADSLDKKSQVTVVEGANGMKLENGTVYIAPGGKQMKIEKCGMATVIKITDAPPENNCKPSADYLFRSVSEVYKGATLGVIMTGMGNDGTKGLQVMKEHGIKVIGQDKESCVVFGMPMEAIKAGVVDVVLPLDKIASEIVRSL